MYAQAYKSFEAVLGAGKARADMWDGLVMNVLIGVGVGLIAGAVVPVGLGVKAAATFGAKVLEGVVAEHGSWATGQKIDEFTKKGDLPMPPHPLSKRVEAFQKVELVHSSLLDLGQHLGFIARLLTVAGAAGYDCLEVALTGRHSTPFDKLERGVAGLEESAVRLAEVEQAIARVLQRVEQLAAEAALRKKETFTRRTEKHIWVHWMATLSPEAYAEKNPDDKTMLISHNKLRRIAQIVDSDPIERRLEELDLLAANAYEGPSDLGWYVGSTTHRTSRSRGPSRAHRLSKALENVGKQGALQQNPMRPDPYQKDGRRRAESSSRQARRASADAASRPLPTCGGRRERDHP